MINETCIDAKMPLNSNIDSSDGISTKEVLTESQQKVLSRLMEGSTNRKIAEDLHVSERTVEFHLGNIMNKLGLNSRWKVMKWGMKNGFSPTEDE